ncbi:GTP-binding protein 2 isoform X1 [Pieris rapae]|uniref:GTP-binding protein 2 isoform X1 n=2 Tax=Pieris rapae TaxID=64459 RepID=UPI001E27B1E2|nr:GTP-binding protein 2 isoform X1 [Pieris rapae]
MVEAVETNMDSFFSLFDPSDGQNKPKKRHKNDQEKCNDAPKGRRRGRRGQGKNETLPEESSFLCEPQLSTEILVKDCSYIENYIEVNNKDEDSKESDKKPRRRNSGRKSRRRKNKISPGKDLLPGMAWHEEANCAGETPNLNNQSTKLKTTDEKLGKIVNNLKNVKEDKRDDYERVYNVIDKLEKVGIKDNMYLSGDFDDDKWESDFFYSDDDEEFRDDSTSDADDTGDEYFGCLPPEPRFGNVEYKLQLVSPCERRFQHLVTQLKWRLRSGGGTAVYVIGVRDCGALKGLRANALRASLRALRRMASAIGAVLVSVRARRVASNRAVAEVYIRKLADTQQSVELRVAVMGANEAGKSTLIGVLTQGELDNGRGSARLNMFRHLHEVKSGRTSSLSHEILGFDAQGNVVNYGCSELMTAERIGERSAKLVSFLDLAGHSKYQRTTVHGLSGYCPHYAMIVISATAGITSITEEHIGLLLALDMPFFAVISKCELANAAVGPLVDKLRALLVNAKKKPLLITDENLARNCVVPQKSILDTIDDTDQRQDEEEVEQIPVFPVSCVRGVGLNALHAYLLALRPPTEDSQPSSVDTESCEFQIDEIFHVGESSGPVVGGLVARGRLLEGDDLIIGPLDTGEFVEISVKTIFRNRVPCGSARAGQSASLGLSRDPPNLRPGMVLLTRPGRYRSGQRPVWGCTENCTKSTSQMVPKTQNQEKNRKNVKRKNNFLQEVTNLQKILTKTLPFDKNVNEMDKSGIGQVEGVDELFREDFDKSTGEREESGKCACAGRVWLEDPNDPRGCLYFQATVLVIRHSTAIYPGFQCTVHVGNVRQTAIIEGILAPNSVVRAGETAPVVFRFARCPEYLLRGRRLLFTAGLGTRAIGRITQTFPYIP